MRTIGQGMSVRSGNGRSLQRMRVRGVLPWWGRFFLGDSIFITEKGV